MTLSRRDRQLGLVERWSGPTLPGQLSIFRHVRVPVVCPSAFFNDSLSKPSSVNSKYRMLSTPGQLPRVGEPSTWWMTIPFGKSKLTFPQYV